MLEKFSNESLATRNNILLEQLVLVDGQPGCGKTLFSAIIAAMERVELLNYSSELESICAVHYLKKITDDAAKAMIRIQMDVEIYETMMSRRTNFRPTDLSSAFRDVDFLIYLKRLFSKGDDFVIERIKKEKPILHFATHNLLAFSEPIFRSFGDKVIFVEIVRHPLYMLIQQTINQIKYNDNSNNVRQFQLNIKHDNGHVPFWNYGQEKLYLQSNPVERAIYEMRKLAELTESFKEQMLKERDVNILTIPFEPFVLNPWKYLKKIEELLKSKITSKTKKIIKKQKVPRKKISDGIPLAIYKRCGWEAPDRSLSEKEELEKRRQFALDQGACDHSLKVLDHICKEYETNYFKLN